MCVECLTNKSTHKLTTSSHDSSSNPVSDFHYYELPTALDIQPFKKFNNLRSCTVHVDSIESFICPANAHDSVRREVLYRILIEFGIPKKLVSLIKMSLTETYSRVRVGKNVSDRFPIRNGLKKGDALSPLLFNIGLGYAIRRIQVNMA